MPRPKKERIVFKPPVFDRFKPAGVRASMLQRVELSIDEYEAIRLADYLGYNHLEASKIMNISRSTFSRLIDTARSKVASFLIDGKELFILGGAYKFAKHLARCLDCGQIYDIDENRGCPNCSSERFLLLEESFGRRGGGRHRHRGQHKNHRG